MLTLRLDRAAPSTVEIHFDDIHGNMGDDTVSGGGGDDRITDFNPAQGNRIRWEGGVPDYTVTQVGADTVIALCGDQVRLVGVSAASLTGMGWFVAA